MSTDQDELLSAIQALDPSGPWGTIGGIFDKMEIAEDMITEARCEHPAHDVELWNAFALLVPGKPLHEAPEPVYRAHCAELLARVRQGQDTTLGTKAEIMMGLSETSLATPLMHTASVLYAKLFLEILPDVPVDDQIAYLATQSFDTTTDRLLADLALKVRVPDRKPKEESEWQTPPAL